MRSERIISLIEQYRPGYGLPAGFYTDPDVWAADIELLTPLWYVVGHTSQIPDPGDTKVVSLFGESVIVVRGGDGVIRAFYNVCSHRAARICDESARGLRQFTCPYHNWSYSLEGKVKSRRLEVVFDDTFDPDAHNLRPCHLRVFEGLIFLSLADKPTDFDAAHQPFEELFRFYGIADTKVIRVHGFPAAANWKTLVENTIDPYHVPVVHPNFTRTRTPAYWQAAAATRTAEVIAAATQAEHDFPIWERTYQGATSRAYRPGRLAPQESFIGEFQRWYVRRLGQQVGAPEPVLA